MIVIKVFIILIYVMVRGGKKESFYMAISILYGLAFPAGLGPWIFP